MTDRVLVDTNMMWASAVINRVPTIYSEDMPDGQTIEEVLIKNPLAM